MSPSLLALLLGAGFLHAAWNALVKGGDNKLFESGLVSLGGACGALCLLPLFPLPAPQSALFLASSSLLHVAYYWCLAVAYSLLDMSCAYTLMRGLAPLLTALVLALSGAPLSGHGWLGVLLICGGVLTLLVEAL